MTRAINNLILNKTSIQIPYDQAIEGVTARLDRERGVVFSSNVEFPDRYTCYDIGLVNPPLIINGYGLNFTLEALNQRGELLLAALSVLLSAHPALDLITRSLSTLKGKIKSSDQYFAEEHRSKQPSIFTLIRIILKAFKADDDEYLGLYGALGYDLAFQFQPINPKLMRDPNQRDVALYFPDEIYVVDHRRMTATIHRYEFIINDTSTESLPREGTQQPFVAASRCPKTRSTPKGAYAQTVNKAKAYFSRGDLFEVVPSQSFYQTCKHTPAELFNELRHTNPSPYSFIFNLGDQEYLVGISPEMFVRVSGTKVESRPISGTIKRGHDPLEDAENILELLNSKKEESELTMCTDVDRNDKSRVCVPGSVKLTRRREIEKYSKLFHTVDHVEGRLAPEFDALDAFLSHTWAVTLTGAPKKAAMQFIEDHEQTPRHWYGGAIGYLKCNGDMNTGITIRTIAIKKGIAEVRVGATLLNDSNAHEEEKETELKAEALLQVLNSPKFQENPISQIQRPPINKKVLLIDHEDSFVNTLGNYFRQCGATVMTVRHNFPSDILNKFKPELIVLSPGPGKPDDFNLKRSISLALANEIPLFGVCLGLQGIVEHFGGKLKQLANPMHGKKSHINVINESFFKELPKTFNVGRYHSLYADAKTLPKELKVTALSEDNIIMAVEHHHRPIVAVQFHPESIMSGKANIGLEIIYAALRQLAQ